MATFTQSARTAVSNRFVQGVASLAGGTALGQFVLLIATPLLTRLYAPDDLGKLGLFVAFLAFTGNSVALYYDMAVVNATTSEEADELSLVALLLVIPMSVAAGLVSWALIHLRYLGYGAFPEWMATLVALGTALNGWLFVFRYRCVRDQSFGAIMQIPIFQNLGRAITQVGFGLLHLDWIGLCWGELIGRTIGLRTVAKVSLGGIRHAAKTLGRAKARSLLLRHKDFPLYIFPSNLIGATALSIPVLLMAQFYGLFAAGYFALVQRILSVPLAVIGASVADVFHARLAEIVNLGKASPRAFLAKTTIGLALIGAGPMVLVMLAGPSLFGLVLGNKWTEAGRFAVYVAPWALAQLAVCPVTRIVAVLEGKKFKLMYDALSLTGTVVVLWFAHRSGMTAESAVILLSGFNVLTYVFYLAILFSIVTRHESNLAYMPADFSQRIS